MTYVEIFKPITLTLCVYKTTYRVLHQSVYIILCDRYKFCDLFHLYCKVHT